MKPRELPPAPVEVIKVEPLVLREEDAARILGVAASTLCCWRKEGRGPKFRRFGTAVVYDMEELRVFVAAHPKCQSTTEADLKRAG